MREAGLKAVANATQGNEVDLTNPNVVLAPKIDVDKLLEDKVNGSASGAGAAAAYRPPVPAIHVPIRPRYGPARIPRR